MGRAPLAEEFEEGPGAGVGKHTPNNLDSIGQRRLPNNINDRAHGPRFLLVGAKDKRRNSRRQQRPRTHRARLEGDHQLRVLEDHIATALGGHSDRLHLRMRCGIAGVTTRVDTPAEDLAGRVKYCGGDRDIGKRRGEEAKHCSHPFLAPPVGQVNKHHSP